jgi:hypothetical protein
VVTDISKELMVLPSFSRVKWIKKMKALQSFETLGTTHPATQHHIPEDLNPELVT